MVKLIAKIDRKIEKVLKKLNLFPKETPKEFIKRTQGKKHRYSTVCENKDRQKFLFYARLHDSEREKQRMLAEIKVAQFLKKRKVSFFPKYFLWKREKDFEWILREYFQASVLERKNDIERLKRPLKESEIDQICKALILMQKLKVSGLKKRDLKSFFEIPQKIERAGILEKKDVEKIKNLFEKNKKLLFKENKYFCHGDFQIGNLIFEKGKLKIVDFESAHYGNFAFDACFFWMRLWREKKARRVFLQKLLKILPSQKKEKFKKLFWLNAFFQAFHDFSASPREYSKKMLQKRKNYFLFVLKKALEGFERLKKI